MEAEELDAQLVARLGHTLKQKWRLERLLGVGGMGAVYEATHRNGARVAIKMMHTHLSRDRELRERFVSEAYLANAVGHPRVAQVLDDDTADDGTAFLVMELLQGVSLETRRAAPQALSPEQVLCYAVDLLEVLEVAHTKGIVHRDLKPANLFVLREDKLAVLDFGIAGGHLLSGHSDLNTAPGTVLGTPAYMAPEQARGRWDLVDVRTDIWATGATLFTLLTGRHVHPASTANEQLGMAMMFRAPALLSIAPELPIGVAQVVDQALRFEPAERWQSATAMLEACRQALARLDGAGAREEFTAVLGASDSLATRRATLTDVASVSPLTRTPAAGFSLLGSRALGWRRWLPVGTAALAGSLAATLVLAVAERRKPNEPAALATANEPPASTASSQSLARSSLVSSAETQPSLEPQRTRALAVVDAPLGAHPSQDLGQRVLNAKASTTASSSAATGTSGQAPIVRALVTPLAAASSSSTPAAAEPSTPAAAEPSQARPEPASPLFGDSYRRRK